MRKTLIDGCACCLVLLLGVAVAPARASEHVTLANGFEMVCDHQERVGDRVRIYMSAGSTGFLEFAQAEIASVEAGPPSAQTATATPVETAPEPVLTEAELQEMLVKAGSQHNLDVDLLASVIHAESGGNVHAVSRAGARGLMQLMPKTAKELGVADSFHAEENINGGTAYLDSLLVKYHDKLALALAAYNAGPAAVDRWHGVPPYRETRAYVARVIREFNRAVLARRQTATQSAMKTTPASAVKHAESGSGPGIAPSYAGSTRSVAKVPSTTTRAATQLAMAAHAGNLATH